MAARGAREDGGRGSQTRIVELGAGMPVNERKKGAHGLFEAPPPPPRVCTRLFVLARYSPLLSFVYLTRLLFILTTACLCLAPFPPRIASEDAFSNFSRNNRICEYFEGKILGI